MTRTNPVILGLEEANAKTQTKLTTLSVDAGRDDDLRGSLKELGAQLNLEFGDLLLQGPLGAGVPGMQECVTSQA